MNESLCANAIQQAMLALERNDSWSWCVPLVDALETLQEGSSIAWCVEIVSRFYAANATEMNAKTLNDLRRLVSCHSNAAEIHQQSRDIWYAKEMRSDLQTATSKVFEAVAAYVGGDRRRYKRGVAITVSEVAVTGITKTTNERIQHVLIEFNRQCELFQAIERTKDDRQQ